MTEIPADLPVADVDAMVPRNGEVPRLPVRAPVGTQAMATTLRLWRESECHDRATLEHIATGLRTLDTCDRSYRPQDEVDGVIARWRATRPEDPRA